MKKISCFFLALAMSLSLCACMSGGTGISGDTGMSGNDGAAVVSTQAATIAPTMPVPTEPVAEEMTPSTAPVEGNTDPIEDNVNQGGGNTSAGCNHSFSKATCQKPATCSLCGETKGELGDHTFTKTGCSVCGAENPARAEIAAALKAIERYPKYIKINKDLIANEYDLFSSTGDLKYFNDAHKHTLEIQDYLKKVMDKCEDYVGEDFWIKEIVEDSQACILDMPIVPTSIDKSSIRSYISKCKTYSTKADRIFVVYDNLCKDYGVE